MVCILHTGTTSSEWLSKKLCPGVGPHIVYTLPVVALVRMKVWTVKLPEKSSGDPSILEILAKQGNTRTTYANILNRRTDPMQKKNRNLPYISITLPIRKVTFTSLGL